ncbi:MAG: hypothetical protein AAGI10_12280 [Pseudomonadota bacterium]
MTNRLALILAIIIVVCIVIDQAIWSGEVLVFLGKKFMELIEWVAFWR